MAPLIFLPWEWAQISLAFQTLTDLLSALYVNCEMQELFNQLAKILTYEGLTALVTRTAMGLQAELPLYYTKYEAATNTCVKGESLGKTISIIFDYSI